MHFAGSSRILSILMASSIAIAATGCGGDEADEAGNKLSNALSSAITAQGVSSPTARSSSGSSLLSSRAASRRSALEESIASSDVKSVDEQIEEIENRLTESSVSACLAGISLQTAKSQVNCFGPSFNVSGFDNGNYGSFVMSGNHPGGDAGIWTATDGDGEACVAAKMNVAVGDAAALANSSQHLLAGMLCVANVKGMDLPGVGKSIDLASELTDGLDGASFTEAALARADDASGNPVYTITITGTIGDKEVYLQSSNTNASDGTSGRIRGYKEVTGFDGADSYAGFSLVYNKSGSTITQLLKSAQNRSSVTSDFFDASGDVDYTKAAAGENMYFTLLSLNDSTGLGTMRFAWQAGDGDSHARAFQANTSNNGTNDVGFGYSGYGPTLKGNVNVGEISGMICDWALTTTGIGSHGSQISTFANKVQGQTVERNSSGVFIPVDNNFEYAPTTDCVNSGSGTFTSTTTGTSVVKSYATTYAHDLMTYGDFGAIPTITAPTY